MRTHTLCLAGTLVVATLLAYGTQVQEVFGQTGSIVTDEADLLSDKEEGWLAQILRGYADSTSTQIVVVTLPDLGGEDIATRATDIGQSWGVGQQGKDNGIVILVSRDDRKVFIATGFGMEGTIPDVVASRIVREIITPHFKRQEFYEGLAGAADVLIQVAAGEFTAETPVSSPSEKRTGIIGMIFLFVVILLIIRAVIRHNKGKGNGGRGHHNDRHIMFLGIPGIGHGGGGGSWGGGGGGFSGGFGGGGFGGGGAGGGW